MRVMLNGIETTLTGSSRGEECDYCGQAGHTHHRHPEALQDVREWQRVEAAERSA